MRNWIPVVLLGAGLLVGAGCKKKSCETLVTFACERYGEADDADERCERLKRQAESVEEKSCEDTLRLLRETGKLQIKPR